jgi:hypothetical protein
LVILKPKILYVFVPRSRKEHCGLFSDLQPVSRSCSASATPWTPQSLVVSPHENPHRPDMDAEGGAERMLKDELVRAEIWRDDVSAGVVDLRTNR